MKLTRKEVENLLEKKLMLNTFFWLPPGILEPRERSIFSKSVLPYNVKF